MDTVHRPRRLAGRVGVALLAALAVVAGGPVTAASAATTLTISPANASGVPGQSITYTTTDQGTDVTSASTFSITPDGSCAANQCTPAKPGQHTVTANYNGRTVSTTMRVPDRLPVANPDSYTMTAGTTLSVAAPGVLVNDTDADNDPLTAVLGVTTGSGTLVLNANGSFSYTPNDGFQGTDRFTYKANDGRANGNSALTTVTITVGAPQDEPLTLSPATAEGTAGVSQTYTALQHGNDVTASTTFSIEPNGSCQANVCTPASPGGHVITGRKGTASDTATLNVINRQPVAVDDGYTLDSDTTLTVPAPGVLANDSDPDPGTTLTALAFNQPQHGMLTLNPNGSFVYTPDAGYVGGDSFTYRARDGQPQGSSQATVSLTVAQANRAPSAGNDSYTLDSDTVLHVNVPGVLGNDTDPDGNTLTAQLAGAPAHGTLTFNSDGSFDYAPNGGYVGADSFTYTASDGSLSSPPATVSLTVNQANRAPVANNDSYSLDSDTALHVNAPGLLSNDTDADGNTLAAHLATQPAHGMLTVSGDGSFTYTPTGGYVGADSFTYYATDGSLDSAPATVSLTVNQANRAPVAVNDSYSLDSDTTLHVNAPGVLGNDTDADGNTLTAQTVNGPAHGTLTLNGNGSFDYAPDAGYVGADSFTYTASDGTLSSAQATVSLTVNQANRAPTATDDSYLLDSDTTLHVNAPGVLGNDTDPDGNTLNAHVVTQPGHGMLTLSSDGSFDYVPGAGYVGSDSFTYYATDGSLDSAPATVTLTVNQANRAPTATGDSYSLDSDTTLHTPAPGVLGNDTDPDGDPLTAHAVTQPTHGALTLNSDGSFDYAPDAGYVGADSFTYYASDGSLDSAPATVSLTVYQANRAPVATDDSYSLDSDTTLHVTAPGVLGNDTDADGDPLSAQIVTQPAHGTVTLNSDGSLDYTPDSGYVGADSFLYAAYDGHVNSAPARVSLTVNQANRAPVATNDSYSLASDTTLHVVDPGVLGNDTDADGNSLTAHLVTQPTHGTLTLNADGSFDYAPATGYVGADSFTYYASDGNLDSPAATVSLTVNQANRAPSAANDSYSVNRDTTLNVGAPGVLGNDTDPDGNTLSAQLVSGPAHGMLTLNSNGSFSYAPATGYVGADSFTYTASDGSLSSGTATVSLMVNQPNRAPSAANDSYSVNTGTTLNVAAPGVLGNDTDPDGNALTAHAVTQPAHGMLTLNSNGSFSYTPATGYAGSDSFTYYASDGSLNSGNATVSLTVNQPNRAPSAVADSYTTAYQTALNVAAPGVLGNDSDPDGNALTAHAVTQPAHGTLTLNSNGSFNYVPASGYSGSDSFTYYASDGSLHSANTTVSLTVRHANRAPVAAPNSYTTAFQTTLNVAAPGVLGNDTDADGDTLTAHAGSRPTHGTLTLNSDGSFSYVPAAGYSGADSFSYYASDGSLNSVPTKVSLTVSGPTGPTRADVGVSLSSQRVPNNRFTVSVTTKNNGPFTARNVSTVVRLQVGLHAVSAPGGVISKDGRTITYKVASIAAAKSVTSKLTVAPDRGATGTRAISATEQSQTPDPATGNNRASITVRI